MGAWDMTPRGNDAAADLCDSINTKSMSTVVTTGLKGDYDEQLMAAFILVKVATYPVKRLNNHLDRAEGVLVGMLSDDEWLGSWSEPDKKKQIIRKVLRQIHSIKND